MTSSATTQPTLDRTVTLPALVFYGLGVTIGAGIFALIGEILGLAGDNAPLSFLVAGILAGFTGVSYMILVGTFPRAGGEAVFVTRGLGPAAGRVAGLAVIITGIVTGAVVALAFAGYIASLVAVPERITAIALVIVLSVVAWWGVRESVILAAVVTLLEVGILVVVIVSGFDLLDTPNLASDAFVPSLDTAAMSPILAGSVIAFFAFVGFENIANLAEETINPKRTAPIAIVTVLIVSVVLYVLLSLVAVAAPDRAAIAESSAPMATLFEQVSGRDSGLVAVIAAIAMLNGILIQVVMASRVLYGMAREELLPSFFARVDATRQTPARATVIVAAAIIALILSFPLVQLAKITSLVTLAVFSLVNIALFVLGRRKEVTAVGLSRFVGLIGAVLCAALGAWQISDGLI
ncbi:MAG: amino acid permease [Acidimicrobiia bacterium]|nr:amino acid permease [Acidimicrobiia bacterium]